MYSDRRGNGQKPPRTNKRELVQGAFVQDFCTRRLGLLKIGGGPRCGTYFLGGPGCVTKCDRGRGSKLASKSEKNFMDGPLFSHRPKFKQRHVIQHRCNNLSVYNQYMTSVS